MIAAIALGLAAAAAWYVLGPLSPRASAGSPQSTTERARLVHARERALRALRDLALDHATGKMSDADYDALRVQQEAAAIAALHRLDALDDETATAPPPLGARPARD